MIYMVGDGQEESCHSSPPFHPWLRGACNASQEPVTVKQHSPNPSRLPPATERPCCSAGCKYFHHRTDPRRQQHLSGPGRRRMKSDGFIYSSNVRETHTHTHTHAETLHFPNVYWEIRKTTDDSQCVSLEESEKSFFKQSSSQMRTPGQEPLCMFKKFMGPAFLRIVKK